MKVCSKCKIEKDESEFSKNSRNKSSGLQPRCKSCFKQYSLENKEKLRLQKFLYYEENKEKIKLRGSEWRSNNKVKKSNTDREYRKNNIERLKVNRKNYYEKNKEHHLNYGKQYCIDNRKKVNEYKMKHQKKITLELSDSYIKGLIAKDTVPSAQIPQDLVDFHREVIRAKRLLKELQK